MTTKIATLKKPLVIQVQHPLDDKRKVNIQVKVLRYEESLGTTRMCTDVAWIEDGTVHWFRPYYGLPELSAQDLVQVNGILRIDTPDSNIEGIQEIH